MKLGFDLEKGRNIHQKSCVVVVNRKIKSERVFECGNRRITDNEKSTMGKGMFSVMAWTFPFLDIRIIRGTVCWHRQDVL